MRKLSKWSTDITAGLIGGAVFVLFFVALHTQVWIAAGAGLGTYIGVLLLFDRRTRLRPMNYEKYGLDRKSVLATVETMRGKTEIIRRLKKQIKSKKVRSVVTEMADLSDRITDDIVKDPKNIKSARKFVNYYMDATINVLERYVEISGKRLMTDDIIKSLKRSEKMLFSLRDMYKQQLVRFAQEEVFDLDVELELLQKTLDSEEA